MDDDEKNKKPWFGPKKLGYGVSPRSWQGWLTYLVLLAVGLTILLVVHDKRLSWFKPKTNGTGFTPATWQGWLVTFIPIAIILLIMLPIYFKQRKD